MKDVVIPSHCPIFGTKLTPLGVGPRTDDTPSLDRVRPELGYVPGNVVVISWRANRLKNSATIEELEALADFYAVGLRNLNARKGRRARTLRNPA